MTETIISALLPIIITLLLGFIAGWHHDFDAKQGATLNRMVMLYALPLTLFAGMMGIQRTLLLQQGAMAFLLMSGMIISYVIVFIICRYLFHKTLSFSALHALAITGPAVPFVGVPVLGYLYGNLSTVPIALCSLMMNLVQVPITLFLLSQDNANNDANTQSSFIGNIKKTFQEPVVIAPIVAFILLLCNIHIPTQIRTSLQLLGSTTGGVALFASGVMLYSYKVALNSSIAVSVIVKNVLLPLVILGIGWFIGVDRNTLNISVITIAIPTASICVILAVQYKTAEQEMASILFFSTIFSILSMGAFLLFLH